MLFVGPSGCGKSTLLRVIAGLEDATSGSVKIDGEDVSLKPPAERGIAMVFQTYALYPHLNVRDNMALGLKQAGSPKGEIARRVDEAPRMLSLGDYLGRRPAELSGGQRQRVAIGRADRARAQAVPVRRAALQPRRRAAGAIRAWRSRACTAS